MNTEILIKAKHRENMTNELNKIKIKKYDHWFKLSRGKEQLGYITQIHTITSVTMIAYYLSDDLQTEGWRRITFDPLPTRLQFKTVKGQTDLTTKKIPPVTNSKIPAIHL